MNYVAWDLTKDKYGRSLNKYTNQKKYTFQKRKAIIKASVFSYTHLILVQFEILKMENFLWILLFMLLFIISMVVFILPC